MRYIYPHHSMLVLLPPRDQAGAGQGGREGGWISKGYQQQVCTPIQNKMQTICAKVKNIQSKMHVDFCHCRLGSRGWIIDINNEYNDLSTWTTNYGEKHWFRCALYVASAVLGPTTHHKQQTMERNVDINTRCMLLLPPWVHPKETIYLLTMSTTT